MGSILVEKYKIFEAELTGTETGNPFKDVEVTADFSNGTEKLTVKGFYKENGKYAVRFMPQTEGTWSYTVHSNDTQLDGAAGEFTCTSAQEGNHGRVCLKKDVLPKKEVNFYETEDEFQFTYEDGTRFQPFGTTCYA